MIKIKTIEKIMKFSFPLRILIWALIIYVNLLIANEIRFLMEPDIIYQQKIENPYTDV